MRNDATRVLSQFAVRLQYEDLPPEVVQQAKGLILDTIGCTIGGFSVDGGKAYVRVLGDGGGKPEATVLPTGARTSVASAALVNSQLANMLDLDDCFLNMGHHGNSTVMAALAMAERQGASGRDLISAVVAGYEIGCRTALSMEKIARIISPPPDLQIEYAPVYGGGWAIFGTAASAGKVLGLDSEQMVHAFGIAGFGSPVPAMGKIGTARVMPTTKYVPYGVIGWDAVVACLLAREGMTGVPDVLDGDRGYWRMVSSAYCDRDLLVSGLGEKWWIMETTYKVYPTCAWNRPLIWCLEGILREHQIRPEEIESITARTHPVAFNPMWWETEPRNFAETQMSIPWGLAAVALGIPGNLWQARATIESPVVRAMARKVKVDVEPRAIDAYYEQYREGQAVRAVRRTPSTIELKARGKVFTAYSEYGKGDPFTPETRLLDADLAQKFRTYTADLLRSSQVERAIEMLFRLDKVADVRALMPLLTS